MKKLHKFLQITLVITIIITIFLVIANFLRLDVVEGYNAWFWGYLYIYFLIPLIIILFVSLLIYNLNKFGFRGLNNLKWNFIYLSILFVIILLIQNIYRFTGINNSIQLVINNQSNERIDLIEVYGRHDLIEVKDLDPNKSSVQTFRGQQIDYRTLNDYENVISTSYYMNKQWYNKNLVGKWRVISDSLIINFYNRDSLRIEIK